MSVDIYSAIEVQLLKINVTTPVLCALVYSNSNSNSLQEFSDLLSFMAYCTDELLIVGDFNIHICCPSKHLVSDLLCLVDSFNLIQSVLGPTHQRGHTLDLVLSSGFSVSYEIFREHLKLYQSSVKTAKA